jgi:hypothetical protein
MYIGLHTASSNRVTENTDHPLQANKLHREIHVYFVFTNQKRDTSDKNFQQYV